MLFNTIRSYFLFGTAEYDKHFTDIYLAVKQYNQGGDWFSDVDMNDGHLRRQIAENLQAFWPGMESLLGLTRSSARLLNAMHSVAGSMGFFPEGNL